MITSDSLFCNGICIDASLAPEMLDNFLLLNGVLKDWQYRISFGIFQGTPKEVACQQFFPNQILTLNISAVEYSKMPEGL